MTLGLAPKEHGVLSDIKETFIVFGSEQEVEMATIGVMSGRTSGLLFRYTRIKRDRMCPD